MQMKQRNLLTKTLMTFAIVFVMALVCGTQAKAATVAAPTGLKQDYDAKSAVGVTWNEVAGAEQYRVQISTNTSFTDGVYTTRYANSCTFYSDDWSAITAGRSYYVRVASVDSLGNLGAFCSPIEVATRPGTATTSLKHTKSTGTSVTLGWNAVSGSNTYKVIYRKSGSSTEKTVDVNGKTSVTLSNLSKNSEYSAYVYAGRKTAAGYTAYEVSGKYLGSVPVTPQKATSFKVTGFYDSLGEIDVSWKSINCADGYQVQVYTAYKKKDTQVGKTITKNTTSNYAYIKNSTFKKNYCFKVRVRTYCKDSNGKKYYSGWSSWLYTAPQPDVKKLQSTSKGLKATWEKIKGADRYVIYISRKQKSGYKKFGTTTSTSKVITKCGNSKLKSGKKYYVYVVAQNKVGKKYYSGEAMYCWGTKYKK